MKVKRDTHSYPTRKQLSQGPDWPALYYMAGDSLLKHCPSLYLHLGHAHQIGTKVYALSPGLGRRETGSQDSSIHCTGLGEEVGYACLQGICML